MVGVNISHGPSFARWFRFVLCCVNLLGSRFPYFVPGGVVLFLCLATCNCFLYIHVLSGIFWAFFLVYGADSLYKHEMMGFELLSERKRALYDEM